VRSFQANLVAGKPSGFRDISLAERSELRNRRWWPSRSAGRFVTARCIYAERLSEALLRHPPSLKRSALLQELGADGGLRRMVVEVLNDYLVESGYIAVESSGRGAQYRLLRPYRAPAYRPRDDQPPWWAVLEEPERKIITIGMATSHGPQHWNVRPA
jgi:hypothetical protein